MPKPLVIPQRLPTDDFLTPQGVGSKTYKQPALDGSLSFPMMIDWHAQHSPKHTWAVYPKPNGEIQHVTWRHLAHAMHKVAQFIQSHVKVTSASRPVVSVLANRDTLTYNAIMAGILRSGCTAFLISPRNAQAGVVHLLKVSKTVAVVGSSDHLEKKLLDGVKSEYDVPVLEAPLFGDIFDLTIDLEGPFKAILPPLSTPVDNNETTLIIHSSGSTSFPKPIPLSHTGALQWARIPNYGYHDMCGKRIGVQSAPPFHGMGFFHVLGVPIASGSHIAAFPPQEPPIRPTPELVLEAWQTTKIQIGTGPPSNLVEWVKDPLAVKFLTTLEWLRVGGGPLPSPIGDALVGQGVRVLNGWGTTEVGVLSNPSPKEPFGKDWEYIELTRNANPIFEEHDIPGVYEICFPCTRTHYPSVFNDKENWIYRTSDLVALHPTRKGLFKIVGRTDDQLMLSTGEKTNPGPLESIIKGSPLVKNCIYFGRGRFHNGVLIEPASNHPVDVTNDVEVARFRNDVWEFITRANEEAPTHSRIFKEMILIGSKDKPFILTPKGSVSRPRTLDLYSDEIDAIYLAQENASSTTVELPSTINEETLKDFVLKIVTEVMRPNGGSINSEVDFFLQGCDSLQATIIRNRLLAALRQAGKATNAIPANWVYVNSTIDLLGASFYQAFTSTLKVVSAADALAAKIELLNKWASEYTQDYPKHTGTRALPVKSTVLLTGATGTLGSYLLYEFYNDPTVEKIYAVNRAGSTDSVARQKAALVQRGLDVGMLTSGKVVLVEADLARKDWGIDPKLLKEIHDSVTMIVHNAWRLDFNIPIQSFRPNMDSMRNLVEFSLTSPFAEPPRIINTSSVGVISAHPTGWVDETYPDPANVAPTGYGQSKYVAEKILETAPIEATSIRIGQLAGSKINGAWNVTDWLPMIIKSYKACGGLPGSGDDICWLPTDSAAKIIRECSKAKKLPGTLHLVHPTPIKWGVMISAIAKELNVPVIPFDAWIAKMSSPEASDPNVNPAVKLLNYYKNKPLTNGTLGREALGIPRAKTKLTESLSKTMATLPQLGDEDFKLWIKYWRQESFLP